jgi:hypothetical protein
VFNAGFRALFPQNLPFPPYFMQIGLCDTSFEINCFYPDLSQFLRRSNVLHISCTFFYSQSKFLVFRSMLNRALRSKIPDVVSQRLKTLSSDIIHTLLDPQYNSFHQPSFGNLQSVVSNLPNNLQEITHYYFTQGGKLLRPTVSLLMSDACNDSMFSAR